MIVKLNKYIFSDIIRNRVVLFYALFQFGVGFLLFSLEENSSKAILSLLNIELIVIPLISMIFSTIHYYNSYEFIELLLTQPVGRKQVLISEYLAVSFSLVIAFLFGLGLPMLIYFPGPIGITFLITGTGLTFACTAIAFLASVLARDKSRGIGIVLLIWFYFALIYDGLVLMILFSFSEYPLEKLTLFLTSLNPIDLARVSMMLQMDVGALMGYTGAIFKDFFGSAYGVIYTGVTMSIWAIIPVLLSLWFFNKKDL